VEVADQGALAVGTGEEGFPVAAVLDQRCAEDEALVHQRGRASGDFDAHLPPTWYLTAIFALGNAANEHVQAGHLTPEQATDALHVSILRLFGIPRTSRETRTSR
jgi:hypothetical protein